MNKDDLAFFIERMNRHIETLRYLKIYGITDLSALVNVLEEYVKYSQSKKRGETKLTTWKDK